MGRYTQLIPPPSLVVLQQHLKEREEEEEEEEIDGHLDLSLPKNNKDEKENFCYCSGGINENYDGEQEMIIISSDEEDEKSPPPSASSLNRKLLNMICNERERCSSSNLSTENMLKPEKKYKFDNWLKKNIDDNKWSENKESNAAATIQVNEMIHDKLESPLSPLNRGITEEEKREEEYDSLSPNQVGITNEKDGYDDRSSPDQEEITNHEDEEKETYFSSLPGQEGIINAGYDQSSPSPSGQEEITNHEDEEKKTYFSPLPGQEGITNEKDGYNARSSPTVRRFEGKYYTDQEEITNQEDEEEETYFSSLPDQEGTTSGEKGAVVGICDHPQGRIRKAVGESTAAITSFKNQDPRIKRMRNEDDDYDEDNFNNRDRKRRNTAAMNFLNDLNVNYITLSIMQDIFKTLSRITKNNYSNLRITINPSTLYCNTNKCLCPMVQRKHIGKCLYAMETLKNARMTQRWLDAKQTLISNNVIFYDWMMDFYMYCHYLGNEKYKFGLVNNCSVEYDLIVSYTELCIFIKNLAKTVTEHTQTTYNFPYCYNDIFFVFLRQNGQNIQM